MRMPWRKSLRPEVIATIVAALALLGPIWAARDLLIVGAPETKVQLKAYPADLVYGAERPAVTPPNFTFDIPEPLEPAFGGDVATPPIVGRGFCDPAGPNVFPEEPAGFDVTGVVAQGRYLWQQSGEIELATIPIGAPPFATREIRNLQVQPNGSFTYEIRSTSLIGTRVETIQVEPGTAISLTSMSLVALDGSRRDFDPVTPVELLPLPVTIGGTVTGVGVDPVNLRTMVVQGTVSERMRVDACGEVVDAWLVKGTREFRDLENPSATPGAFDYAIAPHLGGLFVYDHIVENGTTPTNPPLPYAFDITASIGQLEPDPLPEG
jgi:hypothetical protein